MHRAADLLVLGQQLERVGELDLAAAARLGVAQYVEDRGVQHITADDGEVAGGVGPVGLLHQAGDPDDVAVAGGLGGRAAVHVDLRGVDLHQRDDTAALALLDLDHPGEEGVARVDEVVAEKDGERLVTDVRRGAEDGVAEAARVALAYVVHGGQVT